MSSFACAAKSGETERTATCAHPTTLHFSPLETFPKPDVTALFRKFMPRSYSKVVTNYEMADNQLRAPPPKRSPRQVEVGSRLLGRFREKYENAMLPIGKAAGNLGLSANVLSILALLVSVAAAVLYSRSDALLGALVLLLSVFLDMLDGAVARATQTASKFGAVLDHVLDRYVEYFVVIGIVAGGFATWFWGLFALIGMLMASYSRAAAESVGGLASCTVGIAERQEKLLLILAGSILVGVWTYSLELSLVLVGVLSHVTVAQRLIYARQQTRGH